MPAVETLQTYVEEDLTVGASSTSLTLANVVVTPPLQRVEIQVQGATIRYRTDGTAPTATVGTLAESGTTIVLSNAGEAWNFRAIRTGATSATLRVRYLR